ncbi:RING-H2 finger protein [Salix suchowensis]|nr:RING-H2 finger protein [Salix suchowensis]
MEPSSSSVYSAQFLAKKITVEFIIVKESQVGLQINRQSFLLRLWELVLRNHRYNRMFTSADISLSPALKASLHFAISDQARKLHGEIDHIFVCDKAVSWDVVENPENPVLPACKPLIPCLKKVKIEQQILGSMDEELICAICLQDFPDGTEAAATNCSHLFHCHCIVKWLSKSTSCPMCRSKLPVG